MLSAPTPPTAEQIRTLAPDGAAARAGEQLATPRRWSSVGRSAEAAWGLCQGSGASPYEVCVAFDGPAYRCSCPSRKVPCKHALGLLFLVAAGSAPDESPPPWAEAWLTGRAARAAAAAVRAVPREVDAEAAARRVESRERKVLRGIDELQRWLADLMRRGLDSTRGEGYRFWDTMAARLVDAQAAGLARSVRGLGAAASAGAQWPHLLLEGVARLHLLCEAYLRLDELPEALRADVRGLIGWTTREEDLAAGDGVEDRWLVVGRRVDETGSQVITARTWLLGEASGRVAVHLAFGVDAAPPTVLALPGQAFRATLAFYPSATPLRASVRPVLEPAGEVAALPGAMSIAELLRAHAGRLARNPFAESWPVVLRDVVPVLRDGGGLVREVGSSEGGAALPVVPAVAMPRLLAASGGSPVTVAGEWDGAAFRPMSVLASGRLADVSVGVDVARGTVGGADDGWEMLVSAALLGTERSGDVALPADAVGEVVATAAGPDPERRLLATAGAVALRRRAGRRPLVDSLPLPAPAADDPRQPVDGRAARLLPVVLFDDPSVLGEYLALALAADRRLPDERIPDLLTVAARNPALRPAILDAAGPRAAWLASVIPELRGAVAIAPHGGDVDAESSWRDAPDATARLAVIRDLRARDAAAATPLLAMHLGEVPADERAALVTSLADGLAPADEPFLHGLRGDRRQDVRRAAADLLARLPGSAVATDLDARAQPLLTMSGRLRQVLAVTLPGLDADLEALGFGGRPPAGLTPEQWLLRQILGHVPPRRWVEWLAVDTATLVERALRSDQARPVLEGWLEAAARFGDASMASALLAEPKVAETIDGPDVASVLDGLPEDERATVVTGIVAKVGPAVLPRLLRRCPAPWPASLGRAVIGVLAASSAVAYPESWFFEVARLAVVAMPVALAVELAVALAYRDQVRSTLAGALETLDLRRELHAAFAELDPSRRTA